MAEIKDTIGVNFPVATLIVLDRHLQHCKEAAKDDPKKYTFAIEMLIQIRRAIILEYKCKNLPSLN
jgi:hypothetical protein